MKRLFASLCIFSLLAAVSCVEKPQTDPTGPGTEEPGPEPGPGPEPPKPEKPTYQDVTLHSAFEEVFTEKSTDVFSFALHESGKDLRYFMAFPSWNESKTKLLLMRVDPADPAGLNGCPSVFTNEHTFYGSYSIRMRLPDIKAVQPNIGLNAVFTTAEQDEKNGYSTIEMMWKMADPTMIYCNSIRCTDRTNDIVKETVNNYKPSGAYYTYGFDWHTDKVTWWIKVGDDKQTIKEIDDAVPCFPARLKFMLYHSKNNPVEGNPNATSAPFYPFEFEIDKIAYEPFEDEIEAWHKEYFND